VAFQNPIAGGQGALEREQIKSPNYVTGSAGWAIKRDGSAEFNNIVIRGGTSVGSTSLWYSGTPALGSLIFSISGTAGTDPYGNHYSSGVVAYSTSLIADVALQNGNVKFGNADADFPNAASIYSGLTAGGDISLDTGLNAGLGLTDQVRAYFRAGHSSQPPGAADTPYFGLIDGDLTSAVDVQLSGAVIKTDNAGTSETWQNPVYRAGWSAGTVFSGLGGDALQYRKMAEDDLWLEGLAEAGGAAGAFVLDLPAGYAPAAGTPHGIVHLDRGGAISTVECAITTAGQVILGAAPVAGDVYSFNFRIPLGHVA